MIRPTRPMASTTVVGLLATVVALALGAVALSVWWPSGDGGTSSAPTTAHTGGTGHSTDESTDSLGAPPALSTDQGELVAVGMQAGTRYAFRLRIDATGITKCTEPTPWPDHADCINNGSSELPVLSVYGPAAQHWVWTTMPTHQAEHPQLWIHHADDTLTVVPLLEHGRLAWPAAAALLRGDERTAELRDGTSVLERLSFRDAAAHATSTVPGDTIVPLGMRDLGGGHLFVVQAVTSPDGRTSICGGNLGGDACRPLDDMSQPALITLSDPDGAGGAAAVAVAPRGLDSIAQLVVFDSDGPSVAAFRPLDGTSVSIAVLMLDRHHGRVELRIGPTIVGMLGAGS